MMGLALSPHLYRDKMEHLYLLTGVLWQGNVMPHVGVPGNRKVFKKC
jgi:hypothetical protein